jgi:hypothetical protein
MTDNEDEGLAGKNGAATYPRRTRFGEFDILVEHVKGHALSESTDVMSIGDS